jgi:hypothetical protein
MAFTRQILWMNRSEASFKLKVQAQNRSVAPPPSAGRLASCGPRNCALVSPTPVKPVHSAVSSTPWPCRLQPIHDECSWLTRTSFESHKPLKMDAILYLNGAPSCNLGVHRARPDGYSSLILAQSCPNVDTDQDIPWPRTFVQRSPRLTRW